MANAAPPSSAPAARHYRLPTVVWVVLASAAACAAIALTLALSSDGTSSPRKPSGTVAPPARSLGTRYDGGPEEGTRGPRLWAAPLSAVNRSPYTGDPYSYNGGHDEGQAGP
jgi:hypothetical protein